MQITLTEFINQLKLEYFLAVEYELFDKAKEIAEEYHALTGKHI